MIRPIKAAAAWIERMPDTRGWFDRHLAAPRKQYVALLLLGLVLRVATFGDPNLHVDESFYFLVGQEMHRGALPYVDIWDRKPLGLFIIYYLIAGISTSVVTYQIAAWLIAGSTAMVIALIARRWIGVQGAVLAGASYLFMIGAQEGYGGQSPVFYNLLIAGAALLLLDQRKALERGNPGWRTFAAMALCGLALTVKQTTLFESIFFGLFVIFCLVRSRIPMPRTAGIALACMGLGALPTVATGSAYYLLGHWAEWWQAMFLSNLAKAGTTVPQALFGFIVMCLRIYPYIGIALVTYAIRDGSTINRGSRIFLVIWIIFSVIGVLSVPNFYTHYALPLIVPLSISAGILLDRRDIGLFIFIFLSVFSIIINGSFNLSSRRASIASLDRMASVIQRHDPAGQLFVFDGPPALYSLAHRRPPTPLAFPHHLNHLIEKNVSQFDTVAEVKRVLQAKPGAVVIGVFPKNRPVMRATRAPVMDYVIRNCRIIAVDSAYEVGRTELVAIWGDCREGAPGRSR